MLHCTEWIYEKSFRYFKSYDCNIHESNFEVLAVVFLMLFFPVTPFLNQVLSLQNSNLQKQSLLLRSIDTEHWSDWHHDWSKFSKLLWSPWVLSCPGDGSMEQAGLHKKHRSVMSRICLKTAISQNNYIDGYFS